MTKVTQNKKSDRITRSRDKVLHKTATKISTKASTKTSKNTSFNAFPDAPIESIENFNVKGGVTLYLIKRKGYANASWSTSSAVQDKEKLREFHERIRTETGYVIEDKDANFNIENVSQRPGRTSKTRATINLMRTHQIDEDDSDMETDKPSRKRKSGGEGGRVVKKSNQLKTGRVRKLKADILKELEESARLERKEARSKLDPNVIMRKLKISDPKECCLQCAITSYRIAMEKDDFREFKKLMNDKERVPHYAEENNHGCDLLNTAILGKKKNFIAFINEAKTKDRKKPTVPHRFTSYGMNTGFHVSKGFRSSTAFRTVQESRGNRQGNAAFYQSIFGSNGMTPENTLYQCHFLRDFMSFIAKPIFKDKEVIDGFIELGGKQESLSVYFSVAAGNYELSARIIEAGDNYFGHNFNHLFAETLKFNGEKKLTNYRKPQILKKAADLHGLTPFHCAAINRSSDYLKEFFEVLDAGEVLETDTLSRTVAHFAAVSETTACLEYLVSVNYTLSQPDKFKITPIVQAARFGRSHNVEFLIKHLSKDADEIPPNLFATAARNKRSLLHFAAFFGHTETCRVLINLGAPVNPVENLEKQTPLHHAAKNGFLDCIVVLIEEGKCDSSAVDKYRRTALHLACINGQFEVVKYLLSVGLDSNATDSSQNLPVHYAAAFGYLEILHLLIHFGGADPNKINLWRSTACSIANMKGHLSLVKYLLDLPDCIDVNFKDQDGLSMLHHTVLETVTSTSEINQNMKQIKLLLNMNADVNSINLEGDTVMHSLVSITTYCNYYPKEWKPYYVDDEAKYAGYRATATLKSTDEDDMTGVNYHLDVGRMLLEKGADINVLNNHGETCLSVAMKAENHYLVAFLIENGARYWSDADRDGNNFFHYFGKLAATIDHLQPHRPVDETQKERFIQAADKVWKSVNKSKPDMEKLNETINKYNKNGRTPILDSALNVVDFQKKAMIREKKQIKSKTSNNRYGYQFGRYNHRNNGQEDNFETITSVKLIFTTMHWVHYMGLLFQKFKPNMNSRLQLPKGYKKANLKAKPASYPRFTGACAIHCAASIQNTEMINFLIQHGSDPNLHIEIEGQEFDTPLIIAYHVKQDKNQEMENNNLATTNEIKKKYDLTKPDFGKMMEDSISALLYHNADPFEINNVGVSSIMKAAKNLDLKMIRNMCQVQQLGKHDINTPNETNKTTLMMVVDAIVGRKELNLPTDSEILSLLLKAGADINKQFANGDTVLLKVIRMCNADVLNVVLNSVAVPIKHEVQNKLKENALIMVSRLNKKKMIQGYVSCLSKDKSTFEQIVNDVNIKGRSALSYVALHGDVETLQAIMTLNPDPNQCHINSIPLIESVESKNIEVVEILLKSGAHVDTQDTDGNTALHKAAASSKHAIVKLLLENKANCDIVNKKNQTPLHLAVDATKKQTNRSFKSERLLLQAGADINAKDLFGRTSFHYIFTDMNTIPITQDTTVVAKKVRQISKEIEAEKKKEETLTKHADDYDLNTKFYANKWILEATTIRYDDIIQRKKSESKKDDEEEEIQMTPEEKAVMRTYVDYKWESAKDSLKHFDPVDMVKYLSSFGSIDYSVKDYFGRTPLHYAACVGAFTCTSFMLKKDIDINDVDTDKNGALQLALRNGHVDYSGMLCDAGSIVNKKVVLKNGKESTTFGHALSLSLINIAYLIMERGVVIIEAIHDALKNGKFHMVELLLDSAEDSKLKETLIADDKNMWHIISDFKPFDSEIWGEYLQNIIECIEPLNLAFCLDKFDKSPIHYAAKHGQINLLKYLLSMKDLRLNVFDKDGNSELDYAVESGYPEIIQLLLEAGSTVDTNSGPEKESILLKAVKQSHYKSAELLLKYGAKTDQDSSFGRENAVMIACVKNDLNMMKILVQASANLDTPSTIERSDQDGKYKMEIRPVFIALPKDELFEFMVNSNVDLNVIGPESRRVLAKPLFMFAVHTKNVKAQELMLKKNIDLNIGDVDDTRTIFYEAFFSHMKFSSDDNMTFGPDIYEQMIQQYRPNVNFVDTTTNMTPLEVAIRERKMAVVERLLQLDANPNLESNGPKSHFLNPDNEILPALVHAALENDEKMFEMIVEKSNYQIHWLWKDTKNRNILSYILGGLNGYSQQSIAMLNYIYKQAPSEFRKLAAMVDESGKNPIVYAKATQNNKLYQVFVKALPKSMTDDIETESEDMETEDVSSMDVDFISSLVVEEDADKERAILQEAKDAKRLDKHKHTKESKEKKAVVDPYSKLEKVGVVAVDEDGSELDIMLLKAEISYSVVCSFYKLSVIYNKVLDVYILWTRWGNLGDEGMHQRTPYLTKEEAAAEFKFIFKSKTNNHWEKRNIDFTRVPGRYDILKTFTHPKDTIIKNFDFTSSRVPSQLSSSNLNLMKLICNFDYFSAVYNNVQIDMPFGQIPYKIIKEAQDILNKILEITDKLPMNHYYADKDKRQESIKLKNQVAQMVVDYHRLLPYKSTLDKSVLETRNMDHFKKQLNRINDLSYVGFAVNVVLGAKHHSKEVHPLDYAYKSLECSLAPIAQESTEFSMINEYMNTTSNRNHELVSVFGVHREEESLNFRQHENDVNRKLLWHGSRIGNIMGILKQGLRAAPSTASNNGAMLGSGIYFADAFSKSVNYSVSFSNSYGPFYKVMFVCEVALGTPHIYAKTSTVDKFTKEDSVKAEGVNSPIAQCAVTDKYGVTVPMGPMERREASQFPESNLLNQSEFCVYDKSRVKIRYLVVVKEKEHCSLCYTPDKNVKVFSEHEIKNFEYKGFNKYETEVAKAYLTHQGKCMKDIYDEDLNEFLDHGLYKNKWETPIDIDANYRICTKCSYTAATSMLVNRIKSSEHNQSIPHSITNRTPCKYGKGCKIQYVLGHAKKYAHWLNDPIKKKNLTEEENNMDTDEDVEMCDETEEETEEESEEETDYDSDDY